MNNSKLVEKISIEVIKTLFLRFDNFPEDATNNRNAPFHEAFLKAFSDKLNNKVNDVPFFISLSSWLHGLNTTLGQSFFDNVARHLSNGEKREYTSKKMHNLYLSQKQRNTIAQILGELSNTTRTPNLHKENSLIFDSTETPEIKAMDFSADVFIEDTDSITAIELKSVKPNSGEIRGEKQKILEGKAALFNLFCNKKINFYIGFPFDPTVDPTYESITSYNKARFISSIINMHKFFDTEETLVADELWDFLSGFQNTMHFILKIINAISTTAFMQKFYFLCDNKNRLLPTYFSQLKEWNLLSELELIEYNDIILQKIENNKTLNRIYNKSMFDSNGNYNYERYNILSSLIRN